MLQRALPLAGLVAGLAGILLQAAISIPAGMEAGRSLPGAVVWFFSFFTILSNIAVLLVHARTVTGERSGMLQLFGTARVRAGVAVAITIVMLVYAAILSHQWQPTGLFFVCDVLLHYVTPLLYLAWWLCWGTDGATRWRDLVAWVSAPLIYLAYVLIRAPIAGEVPYPFLDWAKEGWASVAVAASTIMVLFVVLGSVAIVADHAIARWTGRKSADSNASG